MSTEKSAQLSFLPTTLALVVLVVVGALIVASVVDVLELRSRQVDPNEGLSAAAYQQMDCKQGFASFAMLARVPSWVSWNCPGNKVYYQRKFDEHNATDVAVIAAIQKHRWD